MCNGGMGGSFFDFLGNVTNGINAEAVAKGNAKTVRSVARVEAEKIKKQGKKNAGSARAAAAEMGLDVDVGAAALIEDEHLGDAAYNASITLQDADYQAKRIRRQGSMQRNSYGMAAAGDLISMGSSAMGWK